METTISKWGNSTAVRIPKDILLRSGLKEDSKVEIEAEKGRVIISQKSPKYTLEEIMADTTPEEYRKALSPEDWKFWQTDVGREIVDE
jgi:antitoxin MazE